MNRNNLKKFPLRKVLALVLCYLSLAACSKNSPEEEPKTVFVYNKDFAHRFGLDESKAIDLDPNLYAIALTFKKSYSFMYDQTDPFVLRYHLNHLTAEQGEMVNSHLAVYPILFPQQKKPLFFSYQCYLNLYFKSSSPILHSIALPEGEGALAHDKRTNSQYRVGRDIIRRYFLSFPPDSEVKKLFSRDCAVDMDHYGSYAGPMISNTEKLFTSGSNWNYSDFRYKKYRSTIFQDIHFISLGPPGGYCGSIINLSDKHGTLLWFEKKNGKEYQDKPGGIKFDAKDFFSLSISPAITRSVSLRIAAEHNAGSSRGQWLRLLGY